MRFAKILLLIIFPLILLTGCGAYRSAITFPSANDVFITTGDGDIQKPYTPVGELLVMKIGWRIPIPILSLIPVDDAIPEGILQNEIVPKIKKMGGDGLINMTIDWRPPKGGILGFLGLGTGGQVFIRGTEIKR